MAAIVLFMFGSRPHTLEGSPIHIAVEFNDHAASAYIAMERNLYEAEGLSIKTYENYATGMALAGALSRGDIDAAYICLIPAINAYANAGVPVRVVSGTHLYGYGLVADPHKVKSVKDLQGQGTKIACMREGSVVDVVLHKTMDKYELDKQRVLPQTRRMSPEKAIRAIRAEQIDAAFLPEHWASMAEHYGFKMLCGAKDVWPGMTGSVLVVTQDLIEKEPQTVKKLVRATKKATEWINDNPAQSAQIVARYLSIEGGKAPMQDSIKDKEALKSDPELLARSMERLEYTTSLNRTDIEETLEYMADLGYIKNPFSIDDILDIRFLE